MSFDWKGTLGKVAPWIATALGGPAAGLAIDAVCKAAGLAPSLENAQKAAELAAAGSLTGEQFLALRQSEDAFALKMQEMGYKQIADLEKIAADDRADARSREVKTGDSWTPRLLAAFVILAWVTINGFLVRHSMIAPGQSTSLDSNMEPMLMRILGTLDAAISFVLAYYFGSSAGSERKTELLGKKD